MRINAYHLLLILDCQLGIAAGLKPEKLEGSRDEMDGSAKAEKEDAASAGKSGKNTENTANSDTTAKQKRVRILVTYIPPKINWWAARLRLWWVDICLYLEHSLV